jgi:hypothetical protein
MDHGSVAGQQLTGAEQKIVPRLDRLRGHVFDPQWIDPMGYPGGLGLELADGFRGSALGVALEGFPAGLHEHDDESGQGLPEQQRGQYGQHGNEISGETTGCDPAHCLPYHRSTGQGQPDAPASGGGPRLSGSLEQQPAYDEDESRGRERRKPAEVKRR